MLPKTMWQACCVYNLLLLAPVLSECSPFRSRFWPFEKAATSKALSRFRGGEASAQPPTSMAVGVLDLRPEYPPPSVVFGDGLTNLSGADDGSPFDVVFFGDSVGVFPSGNVVERIEGGEDAVDGCLGAQSAAAEAIGSLCGSICLLVAYDPIGGKTSLHRAAGIKLAAVVNGMRQRHGETEGEESKPRLTLLLYPVGGADSYTGDSYIDKHWDKSGAEYLINRLRTFFSMGGGSEEEEGDVDKDPFESVEIVSIVSPLGIDVAPKTMQVILNKLTAGKGQDDETLTFNTLLQGTYESFGGANKIVFR